MTISSLVKFTLKQLSENQNIDLLDNLYEAILCDSDFFLLALVRCVSVSDFALSEATSKLPNMSFFRIAETQQI